MARFIHLPAVDGCSQAPKAERSKMAEAIRSTKPKIFTIWPFTEKVCWPHIKIEEEWITYLTKQENMTVINIITRMWTTPIHFLHWHSINFKNLNDIVLLPCSRSFNGFSSHWEQNPRIPYLPRTQTSSALPLALSMAHPPTSLLSLKCAKCASAPEPASCPEPVSQTHAHFTPSPVLVAAQSCHFSEAFPPRSNTLHHLTWLVYFLCPAWKVGHKETLLYPQLTHSGFVLNIRWLHNWLVKPRIACLAPGTCPHSLGHIIANQYFYLLQINSYFLFHIVAFYSLQVSRIFYISRLHNLLTYRCS